MSKNRLWVLGAADVEMAAIDQLLRSCREEVAYAVGPDGQRVHPGNAYRAAGWMRGDDFHDAACGSTVYLVECDVPRLDADTDIARVDHHRPGDPGYGKGPEDFRMASSIGQVLMLVAELTGGDPDDAAYSRCPDFPMIAAADHCLEAAYRGRCPGVDPDALMRWRVGQRATHQGRSVEAVMEDITAARRLLGVAVRGSGAHPGQPGERHVIDGRVAFIDGVESAEDAGGWSVPLAFWRWEYADLRHATIPELPEAACREGIPFLSTVRDRDGREKVVLQAAPADLVRRFMAGGLVPGLTDYYGDPARGFAGGYVVAQATGGKS